MPPEMRTELEAEAEGEGADETKADTVDVDRNLRAAAKLEKLGRGVGAAEKYLGRTVKEWTASDVERLKEWVRETAPKHERQPGEEGCDATPRKCDTCGYAVKRGQRVVHSTHYRSGDVVLRNGRVVVLRKGETHHDHDQCLREDDRGPWGTTLVRTPDAKGGVARW